MSSVNKVILVGYLGADPENKSNEKLGIVRLRVATSEKWRSREGTVHEKTEWHQVTLFEKLADVATKYLQKGSLVYIEGSLSTRSWETDSGEKRYATEIRARELKMLGAAPAKKKAQPETDELPF